jgi:hypothetical protein
LRVFDDKATQVYVNHLQAASHKLQATSHKAQATSHKPQTSFSYPYISNSGAAGREIFSPVKSKTAKTRRHRKSCELQAVSRKRSL